MGVAYQIQNPASSMSFFFHFLNTSCMEMLLHCLVFLCLASLCSSKLRMDVFYESLCPDSKHFISQQLAPMYSTLHNDVNINFYPFGKTEITEVNGGYQFECQHGPRECHGNIVQACTIAYVRSSNDKVRLIICMMSQRDPSKAGPGCFRRMKLNYWPIKKCVMNGEGKRIVVNFGKIQNSLIPKPTDVPWINFYGEHSLGFSELEEYGLTKYICETFKLS